MSSQVMCYCKKCRHNTIGISTGMSSMGWFAHIIMTFLTGLLWLVILIPAALFIRTVRCSICGSVAKKL